MKNVCITFINSFAIINKEFVIATSYSYFFLISCDWCKS